MLKRLKAENSSNHNSADEGQSLPDVIWFDQKKVDQNLQKVDHNLQKVDQNRNIEIRPPSAAPTPATPAKADIKARVSSKSEFIVWHSIITVAATTEKLDLDFNRKSDHIENEVTKIGHISRKNPTVSLIKVFSSFDMF